MRFMCFAVASVALLAACVCAPAGPDVIQRIPQREATQSATGEGGARSGAAGRGVAASETQPPAARARRDLGGLESDLLPSSDDLDGSPFSDSFQLEGHSRIKLQSDPAMSKDIEILQEIITF
ncbi:unnamed protein product, partial [Iphiclides podalirius]